MNLHRKWLWEGGKQKVKLEHDYAKAGFALSANPTVWEYSEAEARIDGDVRDGIERLVRKLYIAPNPNGKTRGMTMEEIVDLFLSGYEDFRNQRGVLDRLDRFRPKEARAGKSHMWHKRYSLPYTKVLGFVACCVTSKNRGMRVCERNWGDVKQIASGKRFSLSGDSIKKKAIVYTMARLKESRIKSTPT